ncbi:FCD domain-containing protein [Granulosicoccus antarcticus]|uniref:HTH-type transcriptional regulator LutR n=1 Tax=Granulosicoccus antarcticus IMCC3135 TaxID=1192854 RepID=A0A2Z2NIP7_9GAMM|nr:FCD domain-containing protein [Granulosicoccus antarcticus]ASJ70933.1 HTH-type transcriptional regulator LutR [Granulosicoccus antarcticus IMCC3135]
MAHDQKDDGKRRADDIVQEVEQRILDGRLSVGAILPSERLLMEEFQASRTVVREAITALSNRGLLDCKPRFRPTIRKPGMETAFAITTPIVQQMLAAKGGVENLYKMRVFIESGLVRHAASHADKDGIKTLRDALNANRDAIDDSALFYKTDTAFHRVLYELGDNPILPAVHAGFTSWLAPHWDRMPRMPERNEENYKAHKLIFEGILNRDPDAAEAALNYHLANAWDLVRNTFELS